MRATITESVATLGVRKTAFATRANLTVKAQYRLVSLAGGETLVSGDNSITVSYNILDSEYATQAAEKDARARAVRELSEEIRTRLGVYFARVAGS